MLVQVENLKKSYKTGEIITNVLNEVEMSLDKVEIGVILGLSGSGKSTFLNMIDGI